jgi:hypothetical protein
MRSLKLPRRAFDVGLTRAVEQENGDPTQNVALTDCSDGTWCCQGGNTTCCEEKLGVSIAATIGVPSSASVASTTSTSASTTTGSGAGFPTSIASIPTSTSSDISTTPQPEQEGLSSGAKIGIGLGVGFVVVLISVTIRIWIFNKARRHPYSAKSASLGSDPSAQELPVSEVPQELPENRGPSHFQYEMRANRPPIAELAATGYSRGMLPDVNRYSPR